MRKSIYPATLAAAGLWVAACLVGLWCVAAVPPLTVGWPLGHDLSFEPTAWPFLGIVRTNLFVLVVAAAGLVTFGLTSSVVLLSSGLFLGLLVGAALKDGLTVRMVLWLTLPHSAELLGLWLAGGCGLLGMRYGKAIFLGRLRFADVLWIAKVLLIAALLTIIAAFVESEFTIAEVVKWYAETSHSTRNFF